MVEKRVVGAVAAHERWAYGEGWSAGLDEGRRRGFDEGFGVGFDAGADVVVAQLRTALTAIGAGSSPDARDQRCRSDDPTSFRGQRHEVML